MRTSSFLHMTLAGSRILGAQTCKGMVAAVYSSRVLIVQRDIASLLFSCRQLHCSEYFISCSHKDLSIDVPSYCISTLGLSEAYIAVEKDAKGRYCAGISLSECSLHLSHSVGGVKFELPPRRTDSPLRKRGASESPEYKRTFKK